MTTEREFYETLNRAPPMPDLYPKIVRRIKRQQFRFRAFVAIAATLFICLGGLVALESYRQPKPVSPEVAEALQEVRDYCNGNDLPTVMENYALSLD